MIKVIVFDFDGVIGDTFNLSLKVCRENGKKVTRKQYRDHHNGNVWEEPAVIFTKEEAKKFLERRTELASSKHIFPVKKQLETLATKYKLIILSSSDENIVHKYLSLGKIDTHFTKVLGRQTHESKVEKFKMLFKEYDIRPKECIFVTDTLGDLREAKKVGVPTMAVTWGYHGKTRLKKGKPNLMIHDFEELESAVDRLRRSL